MCGPGECSHMRPGYCGCYFRGTLADRCVGKESAATLLCEGPPAAGAVVLQRSGSVVSAQESLAARSTEKTASWEIHSCARATSAGCASFTVRRTRFEVLAAVICKFTLVKDSSRDRTGCAYECSEYWSRLT